MTIAKTLVVLTGFTVTRLANGGHMQLTSLDGPDAASTFKFKPRFFTSATAVASSVKSAFDN